MEGPLGMLHIVKKISFESKLESKTLQDLVIMKKTSQPTSNIKLASWTAIQPPRKTIYKDVSTSFEDNQISSQEVQSRGKKETGREKKRSISRTVLGFLSSHV